jgi:hypothetical protein
MKKQIVMLGLLVLGVSRFDSLQAAEWGHLTGKFVFEGTAGKPKALAITKDNQVCDQYKDEIVDQQLLIGEQNGLSNVFVYLRPGSNKSLEIHPDHKAAAEKPVVLENFHCMFYPHALGVWAKQQKLLVKNRDPLAQVVKIDTLTNTPINLAMSSEGGEIEHLFSKSEKLPCPVSCGIHPWESAVLLVVDHPYFAVSDKNGEFTIKNLPVGEWDFQIWHEKAGYLAAKPEWKNGRFKQAIKAGDNSLGSLKITSSMLEKKSLFRVLSG